MNRFVFSMCLVVTVAAQAVADPIDYIHDVKPILEKHCYKCHGPKEQSGGLRLDIRSEVFAGGDTYGKSIIPGNAADSPLIQFVGDDGKLSMPLLGEPLSARNIATLTRWVNEGALWPDGVDTAEVEDLSDHWSYKPVGPVAIPKTENNAWARTPIDRFVLARLEQEDLPPAPKADRLAWLRRVSLDLTGLPPTPKDVKAFINDQRPGAYNRVVDRLLGSPRYGEHWAQHWLDVVRFADTWGFEVNTERPHAWPYRDYVINAFNQDTPYDEFIREQIVGDALGKPAATGFLITASALLPGQIGKDLASMKRARQQQLNGIVVNIGQTFLGMTINCARCHDHKFDPISQHDYYAMQAFVAGVDYAARKVTMPDGEAQTVFAGTFHAPDEIHVLIRGSVGQPKEDIIAPAIPHVLGDLELPADAPEQLRRKTLANWIASPENPLTARVMVNRIWQRHFGTGLVKTSNDFGHLGAKPSHPKLLDWLAAEFIRSGWSIKQMHRLIVLSATYRQSTRFDDQGFAKDAAARLLWRYPVRRLTGEAIRDSILLVSGDLSFEMGGPGFNMFKQRGGLSGMTPIKTFSGDGLRRMIYAHRVRGEPSVIFGAFGCPDYGQSTPRRPQSSTPIQALNLLNSRFVIEEARAFAARVKADVGDDKVQQIKRAYQLALSRAPGEEEIADALPIVTKYRLTTLCRCLLNCNEFVYMP